MQNLINYRLGWNHAVYKSPPLVPILTQMNNKVTVLRKHTNITSWCLLFENAKGMRAVLGLNEQEHLKISA
jgi:hypothetical protein